MPVQTQSIPATIACTGCFGIGGIQGTRIAIMAAMAENLGIVMDSATIINAAKCYLCYGMTLGDGVEIVLLQAIADAVGSGISGVTGVYSGHYGAAKPVFVPAGTAAVAYDLDDNYTMWRWDPTIADWV